MPTLIPAHSADPAASCDPEREPPDRPDVVRVTRHASHAERAAVARE